MNKKSNNDPVPIINVESVRAFVAQSDDFGFEMRIAGNIRAILAVDVLHGATYVDPFTLKPRQYDLRFRLQDERKSIYFAVETKNLDPQAPLIVCGRTAEAKENFHDVIVSRGHGHVTEAHIRPSGPTHFRSGDFVGKSILRFGRKGDFEIYEGWSQALSSAKDLVVEAVTKGAPFDTASFGVVFPWLVIPDGALWTVAFDRDGRMAEPAPADYCRYFVGHRYEVERAREPVCLSHVEIMTVAGLKRLLGQLKDFRADMDEWIPDQLRNSYRNG